MSLMIQKRLVEQLKSPAAAFSVADLRIGLGYTVVRLNDGHGGVAWTPKTESHSCTHVHQAGTMTGRPAEELLSLLADGESEIGRAIGLATANALLAALPRPAASREEVIASLNITRDDKVVMVGYFAPVITQIRPIGCELKVVELNPHRGETISADEGRAVLADASVAILTGTSVVNGTCDDLLSSLRSPRAAVLLGPSSPFCPEAFSGTGLTHIAGSRVREPDAVLRIVSEGGGTMIMKKHLDFETVLVS